MPQYILLIEKMIERTNKRTEQMLFHHCVRVCGISQPFTGPLPVIGRLNMEIGSFVGGQSFCFSFRLSVLS